MSLATHIKEHAILGTSVYNPAAVAITGGTINGITTLGLGAASDVKVTRYAAKQLMISGDGTGTASGMTGWVAGNMAGTVSAIGHSDDAFSAPNVALQADGSGNTGLGGFNSVAVYLNNTIKTEWLATAGRGPSITAGTATTDVNALSLTQTMNAAAVAFIGIKGTFTEGASGTASTTNLIDLKYGTAAAETSKFSVSKNGDGYLANSLNFDTALNAVSIQKHGTNGILVAANSTYNSKWLANIFQHNSALVIGWTNGTAYSGTLDTGLSRNAAGVVEVNNGTAGTWRDLKVRQHYVDQTITAGATTGAQTINKAAGTVNFAAAATTLTVTNSLVTTSSTIHCECRTADATAQIKSVVPAAGSFTITLAAAATAETSVGFHVVN